MGGAFGLFGVLRVMGLGGGFFFGVTVGGVFLVVVPAAGLLSSSSVEPVVLVEVGLVAFVGGGLMVTRSGVGGGLGWISRLATALLVMLRGVVVSSSVGKTVAVSNLVGAKDILVCRLAFGSVSLAEATLVCFIFSPWRGEECLPLVPLRFDFPPMVDVLVASVLKGA